jgi:hypothetical protein
MVDRLIEPAGEGKVGERKWEGINWVVKFLSKREVSDGWGKVVNGFVELGGERDVGCVGGNGVSGVDDDVFGYKGDYGFSEWYSANER